MTDKKPKVFLLANTFWNLYNFRSGLIKVLLNSGHEVFAIASRAEDEYEDALQALGCQVRTISIDSKGIHPIRDFCTVFQLLLLYFRERPNVCLLYTAKPNIYGSLVASLFGCTYINNISGLGSAFIHGGWLKTFIAHLYKLTLSKSHRVFFQNRDDLDFFVYTGLIKSKQSGLLPGSGVDLDRYKPEVKIHQLNHNEPFTFILIARMLKDKGVREYVEAASIVHQSFNGIQFQLLGPLGVENPSAISPSQMKNWVQEGSIRYLGSAKDVRPFIASSTCVVLPSYREGTPRTLLEAAAMGKPIITTDVPGCRDVVESNKTGFLCQARSAEDLAQRMMQMIELSNSERKEMGRLGRQKMEKEYGVNLVIDLYMEEIKKVLPDN